MKISISCLGINEMSELRDNSSIIIEEHNHKPSITKEELKAIAGKLNKVYDEVYASTDNEELQEEIEDHLGGAISSFITHLASCIPGYTEPYNTKQ